MRYCLPSALVALSALTVPLSAQKDSAHTCSAVTVGDASYTTCRLSNEAMDRLEVTSAMPSGEAIGTIARLDSLLTAQGRQLLFATNAGIYEAAGVPKGLLVVDSRVTHPLDTSAGPPGQKPICERANFYCPPNGVFFVAGDGAHIWTTRAFAAKYGAGDSAAGVRLATQSGPLLLKDGLLARPFYARSVSRLSRNGVCVQRNGSALFVIADHVNLYEFASTLRDRFQCRDALFLDGNVSEMYAGHGTPQSAQAYGALLFVASPASSSLRAQSRAQERVGIACSLSAAGQDIAIDGVVDLLATLPETKLVPTSLPAEERKRRRRNFIDNMKALRAANPNGALTEIRLPSDNDLAKAVKGAGSITNDALLSCLSQVAQQRWVALTPIFAGYTLLTAIKPKNSNTGAGFEFCDPGQKTQDKHDLARLVVSNMLSLSKVEFAQYLARPGCAAGMLYYLTNFSTE